MCTPCVFDDARRAHSPIVNTVPDCDDLLQPPPQPPPHCYAMIKDGDHMKVEFTVACSSIGQECHGRGHSPDQYGPGKPRFLDPKECGSTGGGERPHQIQASVTEQELKKDQVVVRGSAASTE